MTRKRYIKLMMADGYSRNDANEIAEAAQAYGMSYAETMEYTKYIHKE